MAIFDFLIPRQTPEKVLLKWWIDVQIPGTDHFKGFFTREISVQGLSLIAPELSAFDALIKAGATTFRIRIPGQATPLVVGAHWQDTQEASEAYCTQWRFTDNASQARKILKDALPSAQDAIRRCA